MSKSARTLKYAWAVPVGICYTIESLYFTGRNPLLSAKQCSDCVIKFSLACLSDPSCSYLFIISCQSCPVCAVLSALCCLLCPVCAFPACSILLGLSWPFCLLSCLDYHFVLFPDHSYPTIILALSCFSCPPCYARMPCPAPAFPVFTVLP